MEALISSQMISYNKWYGTGCSLEENKKNSKERERREHRLAKYKLGVIL
jgi:hypothetical protein